MIVGAEIGDLHRHILRYCERLHAVAPAREAGFVAVYRAAGMVENDLGAREVCCQLRSLVEMPERDL